MPCNDPDDAPVTVTVTVTVHMLLGYIGVAGRPVTAVTGETMCGLVWLSPPLLSLLADYASRDTTCPVCRARFARTGDSYARYDSIPADWPTPTARP